MSDSGNDSKATPGEEIAPSLWDRHDLSVLTIALLLFTAGALLAWKQASPSLIVFDESGLHFERLAGWLPGQHPKTRSAGLASTTLGFMPKAPLVEQDSFHIIYRSARDARQRIEVRITPRRSYGNLRGIRAVQRLGQYGEFYWEQSSEEHAIQRRDWLRTEFRYAFKASKSGSPVIANAIEYATIQDTRLYVVTLHGSAETMEALDRHVSPTLQIRDLAMVEPHLE